MKQQTLNRKVSPIGNSSSPQAKDHPAPVKVMHVIEDLENGGAERVLVTLASGLDANRFRPLVCCLTKKGRLAAELEAAGIPVMTMHKRPKIDLALLFRLRKLMRLQKIDIVHTHVFTANFWGRLAGIFAGVPVVITHEHSTFSVDTRYRRWIERALVHRTDKVITVSENLRSRLLQEGRLPPDIVTTIHNGLCLHPSTVNKTKRAQLRRELGLEKFAHVIGTVGRLEYRKNYHLLLEAMKSLLAQHPNTGLLFVGSGPEARSLEQKARDLRITDHVVFAGYRSDVSDLLGTMSTFCLSSSTEGISMAILEAMAAGVPVVATQVGGNPEIIPGREYGILVPAGDATALAQALSETLANRAAAKQMAQRGQARVYDLFDEHRMIQRIEALYLQCVNLQRKRSGQSF